jgi:hypothetical protein
MNHLHCFFRRAAVLAVALLAALPAARAEECKLELVQLESQQPTRMTSENEWLYYNVSAQHFFTQFGKGMPPQSFENDFKKLVKKEPEKYLSEHPFRSVAKLGSRQYCFVLDKKEDKSKGYDRLYFDLNGNGDLTDDEPIDAPTVEQPRVVISGGGEYAYHQFPRVDLKIDVDGKELAYSFFLRVNSQTSPNFSYASASLSAASYRKGEITVDGNPLKLVVLDYNGNGRFDDVMSVSDNIRGAQGEIYPLYGDMLLIDPQKTSRTGTDWYSSTNERRQYISKLNAFEGKFYQIKVSPTGDELTWTPSTTPLGNISSPHAPCSVELIGDQGYLALKLEKDQPTPVPEGKWRLLSYNITIKDWKEPEKKETEEKKEKADKQAPAKSSLWDILAKALSGLNPRVASEATYGPANLSFISARGTRDCEPINVQAEGTTILKFGPPYKTSVRTSSMPGIANLQLVIQGSQGEVVSNLFINGKRPDKPELTITDPKGEVVQTGSFEYG